MLAERVLIFSFDGRGIQVWYWEISKALPYNSIEKHVMGICPDWLVGCVSYQMYAAALRTKRKKDGRPVSARRKASTDRDQPNNAEIYIFLC
jgi:hypothetical protein